MHALISTLLDLKVNDSISLSNINFCVCQNFNKGAFRVDVALYTDQGLGSGEDFYIEKRLRQKGITPQH